MLLRRPAVGQGQGRRPNLNDVETLGAISAINSDKTGTLTMDMMTATKMFAFGQWFSIEGNGYEKSGAILHAAGQQEPDFDGTGLRAHVLCSDATVGDDGSVVGDPTEAALVVLAAKMGVDAEISRREYPRMALVPVRLGLQVHGDLPCGAHR
jgi:Ca2+-transporting ATPase